MNNASYYAILAENGLLKFIYCKIVLAIFLT